MSTIGDGRSEMGVKTRKREVAVQKSFLEWVAVTRPKWRLYSKLFTKGMGILVNYANRPRVGPLIKKFILMEDNDQNQTQSYTFNLNIPLDVKNQIHQTVLPVDVIRKTIMTSEYRAIMHKCLCRSGESCRNYTADLGCIFLGRGAAATVKNGVAREATREEALAHLNKAIGLGLAGMGMWIEVENYLWGIRKEERQQWLEICFCCPCCCIALKNMKKVGPDIQKRFRHMGWQAAWSGACEHCGRCQNVCPMGAIKMIEGNLEISDTCLGCGLCQIHCPSNAIEIKMVSPSRETLPDYFTGFRPVL